MRTKAMRNKAMRTDAMQIDVTRDDVMRIVEGAEQTRLVTALAERGATDLAGSNLASAEL